MTTEPARSEHKKNDPVLLPAQCLFPTSPALTQVVSATGVQGLGPLFLLQSDIFPFLSLPHPAPSLWPLGKGQSQGEE